jgi:GT2 family glycosyltransferase
MISIVICSIDPVRFARVCANYRAVMGDEPHEIVGIHDAKGMSEGYTRGLAQSRGDLVIFSHDDIEILTPEFTERLKRHMSRFDAIGVAGTLRLIGAGWIASGPPYSLGQILHMAGEQYQIAFYGGYRQAMEGAQAMDGLFLAFRREVIMRVGWDQQNFTGFHCYDIDCTYRAYQMGYRLAVVVDLPMLHLSHGNFDHTWQDGAQVFMRKHGATLATLSRRGFRVTAVQVESKEEAVSLMKMHSERLPE